MVIYVTVLIWLVSPHVWVLFSYGIVHVDIPWCTCGFWHVLYIGLGGNSNARQNKKKTWNGLLCGVYLWLPNRKCMSINKTLIFCRSIWIKFTIQVFANCVIPYLSLNFFSWISSSVYLWIYLGTTTTLLNASILVCYINKATCDGPQH